MQGRNQRYQISRPQPIPPPPPLPPSLPSSLPAVAAPLATVSTQQPTAPAPWSSTIPRPLSDIRELSEPSMMDNMIQQRAARLRNARDEARAAPRRINDFEDALQPSQRPRKAMATTTSVPQPQEGGSSSYSSTPEQSTFFTIPQSSVPRRSSSHNYLRSQANPHPFPAETRLKPQPPGQVPPIPTFRSIPNRGESSSPVKQAGLRLDPITSESARRVPSKTHIRCPPPEDILAFPSFKHPRIKLELQVSAPVSVGGGSIEGIVRVTVDDNEQGRHRRSLSIGAISVDLIGFEEVNGSKKATFIALGTDVVDKNHAPPSGMVQPNNPLFVDEKFWSLAPSCSTLPFMISLPLDTGPPPFQSKHANIRFLLSVTAFLRDAGKHYCVRSSQDVHVLPTYDPEKALTSLPSPLTAMDELPMSRPTGHENVRVTAGLHRQVWVSGSSIFVDIHLSNKCRKPIRKLELTLERDILCYRHAAATSLEKTATQARISESNEKSVIAKSSFKPGTGGWSGVDAHASDIRTWELELPRGHGTVRCGKYFEVRYFLNVTAFISSSRFVSVQLPIILIHMTSLDVVPNSVAQVATAIEERRVHRRLSGTRSRKGDRAYLIQRSSSSPAGKPADLERKPSYAQGRAFAAPRQQSLDRQREHRARLEDIQHMMDSSPRKAPLRPPRQVNGLAIRKIGSDVSLGALCFASANAENIKPFDGICYDGATLPSGPQAFRADIGDSRGQPRRAASAQSSHSKHSFAPAKYIKAKGSMVLRRDPPPIAHQIPAYALGLATTPRKISLDEPPSEGPATSLSLRDKLERSRFEFQAVRRKASAKNWWEKRKHRAQDESSHIGDQGMAGWI